MSFSGQACTASLTEVNSISLQKRGLSLEQDLLEDQPGGPTMAVAAISFLVLILLVLSVSDAGPDARKEP